jgi:hypothetical protein
MAAGLISVQKYLRQMPFLSLKTDYDNCIKSRLPFDVCFCEKGADGIVFLSPTVFEMDMQILG